jgi:hypothetical protein
MLPLEFLTEWPGFLLNELALINVAEGSLGGAGGRLWGKS